MSRYCDTVDVVSEHLKQLGAELRAARRAANFTQDALAARAGISRQLLNRIEAGHNAEIASHLAVANALGLTLSTRPAPATNTTSRPSH